MIKKTFIALSFLLSLSTSIGQTDFVKTIDTDELITFWKADSLFNLGEYTEALSYYVQCNPTRKYNVNWPFKKALCFLISGDTLSAQNYIRKHIYSGGYYISVEAINQIPLINVLISNPKIFNQLVENTTRFETNDSICLYPNVQKRLLELRELDQNYRTGSGGDMTVTTIDSMNQIVLDSLINIYGWLGYNEVGTSGENGSFLIIQHSDRNVEFQEKCLALLQTELYNSNINPQYFAMLYDRIKVNKGEPQLFGSQVEIDESIQKFVPKKTYSTQHLNAYRLYMQFGSTIEDYLELMNRRNNLN